MVDYFRRLDYLFVAASVERYDEHDIERTSDLMAYSNLRSRSRNLFGAFCDVRFYVSQGCKMKVPQLDGARAIR